MSGRITLAAAVFAITATAVAATFEDSVDAYVAEQMATQHVPGAGVAVVREGKPLLVKAYGVGNLEWNAPATVNTVFHLGSVTKQFTAMAVLMLLDEGKVSLDDPIGKYVDDAPAAWNAVTLRHLLNQTSGVKNLTALGPGKRQPRLDLSRREVVDLVRGYPLGFEPGERFEYSNTNYFLLGLVVEKASGGGYESFLGKRIFQPLGMKSTRLFDNQDLTPQRSGGYAWRAGRYVNAEYVSPTQPFSAGALSSTAADMAKWLAALDGEPGKLLKRESAELFYTPGKLKEGRESPYAMGWSVSRLAGKNSVAHGGLIPGFNTFIARWPAERLGVVVMTNSIPANGAAAWATRIAVMYFGR